MKAINLPAIGQVFYNASTGYVLHELLDQIQLCKFNGVDSWHIFCHYKKSTSVDDILKSAYSDLKRLSYNGKPCYERDIVTNYVIGFGEVFTVNGMYEWIIIQRPHANFLKCLNSGHEICKQDKDIETIIKEHFGDITTIYIGEKPCYVYA